MKNEYRLHTINFLLGCLLMSFLVNASDKFTPPDTLCDDVDLNLQITPAFASLSCNYPCVSVTANGTSPDNNHSITWVGDLGQSTIEICEPGTYTAILTHIPTGCTTATDIFVGELETPDVSAGQDQQVSCLSPSTVLLGDEGNPAGDFSIQWTGPDGFVSTELQPTIYTPGTYIFSVYESNGGCTVYDTVEVISVYENYSTELNENFCPGDCYSFAGNTYCQAGNYTIDYLSELGCDSIVTLILEEVPLDASIDFPGQVNCYQPELLLNAGNSTIYDEAQLTWSTLDGNIISGLNAPTATVDQGGSYVFTIEWNNCVVADTIMVELNQETPVADAGEDQELHCARNLATLNAIADTLANDLSFQWKGPEQFFATEQTVEVSKSGIYGLTVQDIENGCIIVDQVLVYEEEEYIPEFEIIPSCFNDQSGAINVSNAADRPEFQYTMNESSLQASPGFETLSAGSYLIKWRDEKGCGNEQVIEVPELNAIDLRMEDQYSICSDNYIHLNAAVNIITTPGPVTYLWNDGSTTPALSTNRPGEFWVEITSACETVRHELEVVNDLLPIKNNIYVPNAFSPNGDQVNDLFRAYINHDIIAYEFQIFDRRGGKMFSTEDHFEGWDGTIKGKKAASGVYAWKMRITVTTCGGGRDDGVFSGDFTLFR